MAHCEIRMFLFINQSFKTVSFAQETTTSWRQHTCCVCAYNTLPQPFLQGVLENCCSKSSVGSKALHGLVSSRHACVWRAGLCSAWAHEEKSSSAVSDQMNTSTGPHVTRLILRNTSSHPRTHTHLLFTLSLYCWTLLPGIHHLSLIEARYVFFFFNSFISLLLSAVNLPKKLLQLNLDQLELLMYSGHVMFSFTFIIFF